MKAVVFDDFGTADVLRLTDPPMPERRPGDLLVKVKAAGVNRAGLLQRQGYYGRQSYGESDLLGLEVAGEVIVVGNDVTDVHPGECVMAIVGGGAYAEFARVDRGMAVSADRLRQADKCPRSALRLASGRIRPVRSIARGAVPTAHISAIVSPFRSAAAGSTASAPDKRAPSRR